jgi:hypothetical protein
MPANDDYGHDLPTEDDALQALGELVGAETAYGLWELGARALGIARPVQSAADMRRMAEHLMNLGDLVRVSARSLKVRVITHDALARAVPA